MTTQRHSECEVSIIIVSWNTYEVLRGCLRSIAMETTLSHEVIVVDNASTDPTVEMVLQEFPDITLLANDHNRGFAAANNQGLRIATGKKVLLLNPDTVVLQGAIDRVAAWLDNHSDVGCVGCQVLEDDHTIQKTCFADPSPVNVALTEFGIHRFAARNSVLGRPEYNDWDRNSQRDVDVVSGMFMMVPRSVLGVVGELDERFFVYSEEADWCRRIRDAGWRCVFMPEATILHLDGGSKSTVQIPSQMYIQMQKSKILFIRKHYGLRGEILTRSIFFWSALLRALIFGTYSLAKRDRNNLARFRLARASLHYHLTAREPEHEQS